MRLPQRLQKGDKVALITPASPIKVARLKQAVEIVESLGLKPVWGDKVHKHYGYLAGTDEQRLAELLEAFTDPQVKAVFAVRGGYGTLRLLDKIPYRVIRRNPKIFLGFSDITGLQMAFLKKASLPSLHVNLASLKHEYTQDIFRQMVMEAQPVELPFETGFTPRPSVIVPGKARGMLIGGNLSLLVSLIGTGFLPSMRGKIVFIEEVNEPPYKIDRMLTQLFLTTDIDKAAGIVLGVFNKCNRENFYEKPEASLSLKDIFLEKFGNMNVPVIGGFPLGHIDKMSILPLGIKIELDTDRLMLKMLTPFVK